MRKVKMTKKYFVHAINAATTHVELDGVVKTYLAEIGETERARGETYAETCGRLGGDKVLAAAERRWWELER